MAPCNCGKNRTAPLGSTQNPKTKKSSMPVADKPKGKEQKFTLETREGKVMTFGSALEARAERKRRGGGILR